MPAAGRFTARAVGGAVAGLWLGVAAAQGQDDGFRWERLDDLPMAVVAPAASVSGDRLVVTGGITFGGGTSDLVQIMDLSAKKWVRVVRLGQARYEHAQVTLDDGRALVVGGKVHPAAGWPTPTASCELIDPGAPGDAMVQPAADLPQPIGTPVALKLDDGRVAVVGEWIGSVYDPTTNAWSKPIKLDRRRVEHTAVVVGPQTVMVIGGTGRWEFERVDFATGRTHRYRQPHLPMLMDDMTAWRLEDGRIWVIGGQFINGQTTDRTWLASLTSAGHLVLIEDGPSLDFPAGISDHVLIETRWGLVAAGGEAENAQGHDSELPVALLLDPATLSVRRLPDTDVAHDDAAAVAWDGTIVLLGGQAPGRVLDFEVPMPVRTVHMLVHEGENNP